MVDDVKPEQADKIRIRVLRLHAASKQQQLWQKEQRQQQHHGRAALSVSSSDGKEEGEENEEKAGEPEVEEKKMELEMEEEKEMEKEKAATNPMRVTRSKTGPTQPAAGQALGDKTAFVQQLQQRHQKQTTLQQPEVPILC